MTAGQSMHGQRCRHAGFSLIEQIMVVAILAVLVGIAAPSMRRLVSRDQLQAAQGEFISALQLARSNAVTRRQRSLFCPSNDGARCNDDIHWENGWLLAHDGDNDHQPDAAPVRVGQRHQARVTVLGSIGRRYVTFRPDGSASGSNITLLFCHAGQPERALQVVVSNSGRIRGATASASQAVACAATPLSP